MGSPEFCFDDHKTVLVPEITNKSKKKTPKFVPGTSSASLTAKNGRFNLFLLPAGYFWGWNQVDHKG